MDHIFICYSYMFDLKDRSLWGDL